VTVADWIVPPRTVNVAGWLNGRTAAAASIVGVAAVGAADDERAAIVVAPLGHRDLAGSGEELTGDGLFPNDAGYAVMAPLAENAIAEALKR